MATLDPLVGGTNAGGSGGSCTINVPTGTAPGDIMLLIALGRNHNFSTLSGWTNLWTATGSGETSFTSPLVNVRLAPDPVPASYTLSTSPSFNWAMAMVSYRRAYLTPPSSLDALNSVGQYAANAATTSSVDPGSLTAKNPGKAVLLIAANSGDNTQVVNYTGGSWRVVTASSGGSGGRITAAICDLTIPAGATDPSAVSMDRSEPMAYMALPLATILDSLQAVSY